MSRSGGRWSIKLLKESLLVRASEKSAEQPMMTLRAIMWSWAHQMLDFLRHLTHVPRRGVKSITAAILQLPTSFNSESKDWKLERYLWTRLKR